MLDRHLGMIAAASMVFLISACAPTTGSFEGSSDTSSNTTEASSDLTSSTSPSGDDDEAKAELVMQYARANYTRLRADMAVGQGEHLTSMAVLLEVDEAQREDFYAMTKNNFDKLYVSSQTTPEEMVAQLNVEMAQL